MSPKKAATLRARKISSKHTCWLVLITTPLIASLKGWQFRKRSTRKRRPKHEAPKSRKRGTQNSKTEHPKLENEAPKSRNHCRLKDYNFKSCMTQAKPGGGNGCVRTSKGPTIHPTEHFISRLQRQDGIDIYWSKTSFLSRFCLRKHPLEHFASTYIDHCRSYQ